jgi:hypothetical protein
MGAGGRSLHTDKSLVKRAHEERNLVDRRDWELTEISFEILN